jgi:hypothetical protein
MMQSGYEFVSPPRVRRHGGARAGAGRKSKATPERKESRNVRQDRSRAQNRAEFVKVGDRLVRYMKRGYVGADYVRDQARYVELAGLLGTSKGIVKFPTSSPRSGEDGEASHLSPSSTSEEEDDREGSSSSESAVNISYIEIGMF